jgi:hypothetical protein
MNRPSGETRILNVVKNGMGFEMGKVKKLLQNSIRMEGQNIPSIMQRLNPHVINTGKIPKLDRERRKQREAKKHTLLSKPS